MDALILPFLEGDYRHPFDIESGDRRLYNIISGLVFSEAEKEFSMTINGSQLFLDFLEKRFVNKTESFHAPTNSPPPIFS